MGAADREVVSLLRTHLAVITSCITQARHAVLISRSQAEVHERALQDDASMIERQIADRSEAAERHKLVFKHIDDLYSQIFDIRVSGFVEGKEASRELVSDHFISQQPLHQI